MLLSLSTIQSLVTTVLMLCAYGFSATLTEAGQAWVALKAGDDSAAKHGWLSLNPFDHIDAVGIFLVIFLGFPWASIFPIQPHKIPADFSSIIKRFFVYCVQGIISLIIAIFALIILVLTLGDKSVSPAFSGFWSGVPLTEFTRLFPSYSSFAIISTLFLVSLVFCNLFIGPISLISNTVYYLFYLIGRRQKYNAVSIMHSTMVVWILSFGFIILFSDVLRNIFLTIIMHSALLISRLSGGI